jgi:ketosteroid isomerase-like protein
MRVALVFAASLMLASSCATPPPRGADALLAEAQTFMAGYERELRAHDREAVIARYDPDGTWFLGDGDREFAPHADTATRYRTRWKGPAAFAFHDLAYEPAPPDAVVVVGTFEWQAAGAAGPSRYSYSALLRRGADGRLRLRVEDESGAAR